MLKKIKSIFGAQDMTVGRPIRSILLFIVPLLLGNVLQLTYNTVDSIVVGQFSGPNGLSAIGVSMPIQFMFAVFFMTVGTGVSVMVSQYFGAKDKENLSKTVGNSLLLILIATVLATILGLSLSDWILRITSCPPEVFENAKAYLMIMFLGFVGMGFYNILGGILRGFGDATFPLLVLFGTTILNIFLDIWMVATPDQLSFGLGWGVAGAAWATIIAQTLSAVICLARLLRMKHIAEVNRSTMKLDKQIVKTIVRIGIPSGLQQMIMSMSFVFVQSIINSILIPFGTGAAGEVLFNGAIFVAVNTAVMRIDGFAMMPAQTFNQAASTFTGQNIGAGKLDRVSKGVKICLTMALSITLIVFVVIWFFGRDLMMMFINETEASILDEAQLNGFASSIDFIRTMGFETIETYITARIDKIVEVGYQMQRIMVFGYFLMAIANTIGGVMRGAGDTLAQLWIMIATNIVVRIPLTVIMVNLSKSAEYPNGAPSSIFLSMIIAFGLNVLTTCIYFSTGRWKTKAVVRRAPPTPAEG
ncbi:MAG: MATE family efflux transporter [Oscillospiraceae bacterium]|jgi:putative MATE family efflux protein|nr:MATE family efflux transporter [Oscillospiraceae bacterium]